MLFRFVSYEVLGCVACLTSKETGLVIDGQPYGNTFPQSNEGLSTRNKLDIHYMRHPPDELGWLRSIFAHCVRLCVTAGKISFAMS